MTYNPSIPLVSDFMVISQPQILSNFSSIFSLFSQNHVPLNSLVPGRIQGFHNVLTLRPQTSDPNTAIDQLALYSKTIGGITSVFFRPSNNQTPIQLTYPSLSTGLQSSNPDVYLPRQYSFMAGPFVMYFGIISVTDGTVVSLTPASTLLYVGLILAGGGFGGLNQSAAATAINSGGTNFTVRFPAAAGIVSFPIAYIAIGK